jgi:IclR family pca regulon transcriptional regulator
MSTPLIQAVENAFTILKALMSADSPVSARAVANVTGMAHPTVHRYLLSLLEAGAVKRLHDGRYISGWEPIVGQDYIEINDTAIRSTFTLHCRLLAQDLGRTVQAAILDDNMVLYIAKATIPGFRSIASRTGTHLEAYCTGLGKVLLAYAPPDHLDAYMSLGDFSPLTPSTITDPEAFRKELRRIRQNGFAVDDEEFEQGLRCIAVPVLQADGSAIAALSVSTDASVSSPDDVEGLADMLKKRAQMIKCAL